jgi:hypothetical protein
LANVLPAWTSGGRIVYFPPGEERYAGVSFDPGDGVHYGWIGVLNGAPSEVFAWGYESDAGVPIPAGAPEPGSLALLAMGAGAALRRRRRLA